LGCSPLSFRCCWCLR